MPKKAASATSPKNLRVLVNLKHLGNLHNELSHGNWSQGPRGKLVGAVRRRLGDDIDDAAVQGGGGVRGKPKISKTLSSIQDIKLSRNAVIQVIDSKNFTGRQLQQLTAKLGTEIRKWKDNPNRPDIDAHMSTEMAEDALGSARESVGRSSRGQFKHAFLVVLRDGDGRCVGVASYRKSEQQAWVVEYLGTNPRASNRAGETIMYHIGNTVGREANDKVVTLNPLEDAVRFYEKIGFLPIHPQLPFMAWEPTRRQEFVARVQARLDAENAAPPSESTKEKGVLKMTPELEKYFAELDAIYEKYGCSVGSPSSAKKAASATSSKSLRVLVNLKHLGNLHNKLSHGNWSKGSLSLAKKPVRFKHLRDLHEQRTHGNWSTGSSTDGNNLKQGARERLAAELGTALGGSGASASPVQYATGGKVTGSSPTIKTELDEILKDEQQIRPNSRVTELRSEDLSPEQIEHVQKVLNEAVNLWKDKDNTKVGTYAASVAETAIKQLSGHKLELKYLPPGTSPTRVGVVRDSTGAITGIFSYYGYGNSFSLTNIGSNPSGGNRSGETAIFTLANKVGKDGTIELAFPVPSARPFYEKIGMRAGESKIIDGYSSSDMEMYFPKGAVDTFRAAVRNRISDERVTETVGKLKADATRWETQLLQKGGESTKEIRKLKSTPEQIKMLDEANALFEKYGCLVSSPSSAKKTASATSSKSLRVRLYWNKI